MQKLLTSFILMISIVACSQKKETFDNYTASIKDYQHKMNKKFTDAIGSPLTKEDRKIFKSLDFFAIDSTYKVTAKFEKYKNPKTFAMPTTTDRLPIYKTYGVAIFNIDDKKLSLHVYQNQEIITNSAYENHLFIPFMDDTNGDESYGGGRFIDVNIPEGDTLVIDFNKAYNPYCAYNHNYSCPIPPAENKLDARIKAGVKTYKK